jgi:membrane-associated protease RseP (regulator of RpoE activity)
LETTYLVLLALAVIYVPLYLWVRFSPNASKYGLVKYGPCIMIKTQLGTRIMDRLSVYTRFWRFFGLLSIAISFFLMACILYIVVVGILNMASSFSAPGLGVEYALAIPGLNPLLPLGYGILGLVVAMVIHEMAHGFQTRSNGMRVDSTGLLYGVVPLGAFVEPNEEDIAKSTRRVKLDLYSAGISVNFLAAVAVFSIFAVAMLGGISSPYGNNAAVYGITEYSELPNGAIITEINGVEYQYSEDYTIDYGWQPGDLVTVSYLTEDGPHTANVRWGLYIERVAGGPAEGRLAQGTFLTSITIKGEAEGTKIYGYHEFISYMETTVPGMEVTITCVDTNGNDLAPIDLVLGTKGSVGYIGISTTTSGMNFMTPDEVLDIARNPFYGADTLRDAATGLMSYIAGPFEGFSPLPDSVHWWYDVPLGEAFWLIVNSLFWIFWLNIMLGVSNAIPAFPFDGGFIFRDGLDSLLEKLGLKNREKREGLAGSVAGYVSIIMIIAYALVIVAVVF